MFNPMKESTINYGYSYDHKEDRKGETEITILFQVDLIEQVSR
jgi:hypothetical protein